MILYYINGVFLINPLIFSIRQRMEVKDAITDTTDKSLSKLQETVDWEAWHAAAGHEFSD